MPINFLPEGRLLETPENQGATGSLEAILRAMKENTILEGVSLLCTAEHDLLVSFGGFQGRIPRKEAAMGIREGVTREIAILSRVGKPTCFCVTDISVEDGKPQFTLSRRVCQEAAYHHFLKEAAAGRILPATVTRVENFGVFVDIGCGFVSMIGLENLSVSRISHPSLRFTVGQEIHVLLTGADLERQRILLSHKELLGTWEENAAAFTPGMTVSGYVRGIKEYGTFIELAPNLTGLSDQTEGFRENDRVSVYIKSILPHRMKIKLLLIQKLASEQSPGPLRYYRTEGCLKDWRYAPGERVSPAP